MRLLLVAGARPNFMKVAPLITRIRASSLRQEGTPASKVRSVGDIMIDALVANLEKARCSPVLEQLGLAAGGYAYVTLHRPANVDDRASLTAIAAALTGLARRMPVVFPMHPRTRRMLSDFGISLGADSRLLILEPVGYHESLRLTENARLVLTDSGGLQEESTYFRIPCLTLRPNTERPVTVRLGSNRLTDTGRLMSDIQDVLGRDAHLGQVPPLWDGRTADRILETLLALA